MAAGTWALERVAADDGAEPAPIADGPDLIQDRVVVLLGRSAREDHHPSPIEGALDHMPNAIRQGSDGYLGLLVDLLGLRLLDVRRGQLHLDGVRTQRPGSLRLCSTKESLY